jgi:hydroxymethylbilane synthase
LSDEPHLPAASTSAAAALRIGTRGSPLALWQARAVAARIEQTGGPRCELVIIKTSGDQLQEAPLSDVGGKRLFVKEIEEALLRHEVDLAVHSSKDLPVELPDGLSIAGVLPREDPRDAVVLPEGAPAVATLEDLVAVLGQKPSIGTGSVRRVAQLKRLLPSAQFAPIRGNLQTRLRKLDDGAHRALVLAAAGLLRLDLGARIAFHLPITACVPAPGQGIVAVETRTDDEPTRLAVLAINDAAAFAALTAERALTTALGGGCQMPIGGLASPVEDQTLELIAVVVAVDGSRAVRGSSRDQWGRAEALGVDVAQQLLAAGADELLGR